MLIRLSHSSHNVRWNVFTSLCIKADQCMLEKPVNLYGTPISGV